MHGGGAEEVAHGAVPVVDVGAGVDKDSPPVHVELDAERVGVAMGSQGAETQRAVVEGEDDAAIGDAGYGDAALGERLDAGGPEERQIGDPFDVARREQPAELLVGAEFVGPANVGAYLERGEGEDVAGVEGFPAAGVEHDALVVIAELDARLFPHAAGGGVMRHPAKGVGDWLGELAARRAQHVRHKAQGFHDEELVVERLLLVYAVGPGLQRNLAPQQRERLVEPGFLPEHDGGYNNARGLDYGVVVCRRVAGVVPAHVGGHDVGAGAEVGGQGAASLVGGLRRLQEACSNEPVDEPDGRLHGARPLGTPHEGVGVVPAREEQTELVEVGGVTRGKEGLRKQRELVVAVELPVGTYVARDALLAEVVVVRELDGPFAARLEGGVPASLVVRVGVGAKELDVGTGREVVVGIVEAKSA